MSNEKKSDQTRNRRRRILINKPLQLRYTYFVVALIVLYSVCLGFYMYKNIRSNTQMLIEHFPDNPKLEEKWDSFDRNQLLMIIFAMILNTAVITYTGIFSTHKVAGPIYRFKKHLASIKSGDFSVRTKLRKNDMLSDLADDFNQASEKIKLFIEEDIGKTEYFAEKINMIEKAIKNSSLTEQEVVKILTTIHDELNELADTKKKMIGI
ncbi:MAG: methyl-accepting chemotaxis protein [Candidatus Auribacterota bacterium]|nr:methyl-accepting chemotaxis protein [Candidatus Auribacterota bacterium]